MPPEYAIDGHFSLKSDVFSFGVIVLEMVSGKKNRGFFHPDHKLNLLGHVSIYSEINSYLFIFCRKYSNLTRTLIKNHEFGYHLGLEIVE